MTAECESEAGFTLVELLVSLAITAAAAGLLTATLAAMRSAREHDEAAAAAGDSVASAQALVRDRIARLVEEGGATPGAAGGTTAGTATALSFLVPPIAAARPSGLVRTTLTLDRGGTLIFAGPSGARLPVIAGVRSLDLAYFGATPDDPVSHWRSGWAGRADPPELVRVRLRFAPGDLRIWPDLVAAPGATVNAICRVDISGGPKGGRCA